MAVRGKECLFQRYSPYSDRAAPVIQTSLLWGIRSIENLGKQIGVLDEPVLLAGAEVLGMLLMLCMERNPGASCTCPGHQAV